MSTSCFPYFQFLLQLPKISSIILILQISKLRYRTIKGLVSWSVSQYASKLEFEVRPIWFQCLVLPVLSQFPTSHMLPYLAQMSPVSKVSFLILSTSLPHLAPLPSTDINRSLVKEEWLLFHFYAIMPFQMHSTFALEKLKLNISGYSYCRL